MAQLSVAASSGLVIAAAVLGAAIAHADGDNNTLIPNNKRLNESVVANVYTVQHQAGCKSDVRINRQLVLAARRHATDLLNNRNLDGDIGSDGSTPQDRASAAGFPGQASETVAINPAIAISGIELINRWYYDPAAMAIMSDCANNSMGVWSLNSMDRTVVVAVYGKGVDIPNPNANLPLDPAPDYDGSDEVEVGINWLAWILRGVYPPPAYPPA